jgi:hypothetical protein
MRTTMRAERDAMSRLNLRDGSVHVLFQRNFHFEWDYPECAQITSMKEFG